MGSGNIIYNQGYLHIDIYRFIANRYLQNCK